MFNISHQQVSYDIQEIANLKNPLKEIDEIKCSLNEIIKLAVKDYASAKPHSKPFFLAEATKCVMLKMRVYGIGLDKTNVNNYISNIQQSLNAEQNGYDGLKDDILEKEFNRRVTNKFLKHKK